MPKLMQTTTTETETTWKGLANLIKGGGGTLKIGDIITEKTLDGEEMDGAEFVRVLRVSYPLYYAAN